VAPEDQFVVDVLNGEDDYTDEEYNDYSDDEGARQDSRMPSSHVLERV
jgi:hypothetical protein